jgi:hypothetical protein
MPLSESTDLEKQITDPNKERMEDVSPIQISADNPEEQANRIKEVITVMSKKFDDYGQWRKPLELLWNDIYRVYFSRPDVIKTPSRAKIFIPVVFQIIEATVPKLINTIFGGDDQFFEVVPANSDDQPQADVIKLLLTYQLIKADFFEKYLEFCKQMLLYGTSYFYVYWKVTRQWVVTRTPTRKKYNVLGYQFGQVLDWEEKREYKVVERRPECEVIDILDVFPDPDARTERDSEGLFIQTWMDKSDLKALGKGKFPVYANVDSQELLNGDNNSFGTSRQSRRATRGTSNAPVGKSTQIHILSWWGKYDLDNDGIKEETQIVLANKAVLLKCGPNPFTHQKRPLIRAVLFPVIGEWFGLGLVEPILSLISELNTLRRQRLDNINQCINNMWQVISWADIDFDTLVSSPNGIILVDNMENLRRLEGKNVTDQAYTEAAIVQQDIENTTAPKSIQGSPDSGKLGRTARGAQLIIGQALEKFGTAAKLIEEMGIKKLLRMFLQLDLQFIDNDEMLQDPLLYGQVFKKPVTPEMIRAEVSFQMKGISELVGQEGKINQIMSFMGIFGKVLSPKTITALAKKIWNLMGFNVDEIEIGAVQPVPPETPGAAQPPSPVEGQLSNGAGGPPAAGL